MSTDEGKAALLSILRCRERSLKRRIKQEKEAMSALRFKSRHVRQGSGLTQRIGFFTDRLQELQAVIALINGQITNKAFVSLQNGDDTDKFAISFK